MFSDAQSKPNAGRPNEPLLEDRQPRGTTTAAPAVTDTTMAVITQDRLRFSGDSSSLGVSFPARVHHAARLAWTREKALLLHVCAAALGQRLLSARCCARSAPALHGSRPATPASSGPAAGAALRTAATRDADGSERRGRCCGEPRPARSARSDAALRRSATWLAAALLRDVACRRKARLPTTTCAATRRPPPALPRLRLLRDDDAACWRSTARRVRSYTRPEVAQRVRGYARPEVAQRVRRGHGHSCVHLGLRL